MQYLVQRFVNQLADGAERLVSLTFHYTYDNQATLCGKHRGLLPRLQEPAEIIDKDGFGRVRRKHRLAVMCRNCVRELR